MAVEGGLHRRALHFTGFFLQARAPCHLSLTDGKQMTGVIE